jgi:hypothetical protein
MPVCLRRSLLTVAAALALGGAADAADPPLAVRRLTPAQPTAASIPGPVEPPPVVDMTPVELPGRHEPVVEMPHGNGHGHGHGHSPPAFLVSAEYLIVRPYRRPNDYAITDPIDNLTPEGRVNTVNYDTSSGFRTSVGLRPGGSGWEALFTYTYVNAGGDDFTAAPPGGLVYPTLTRPGLVDSVTAAAAGIDLDYHLFDFESGRRFCVQDDFTLKLGFGVRYAVIDQTLDAFYAGRDANGTLVRNRIDFDGGGPMVSGEGHWHVWRGWRLFGRARGALVVGDHTATLTETDFGGRAVNANVIESDTTTVPVLELATGVAWEYRNLRLSLGYEVANWFGLLDSPSFVDDFAEGKLGRRRGDLSLEGVFFQLGLAY